jgi:hypothetical protein
MITIQQLFHVSKKTNKGIDRGVKPTKNLRSTTTGLKTKSLLITIVVALLQLTKFFMIRAYAALKIEIRRGVHSATWQQP